MITRRYIYHVHKIILKLGFFQDKSTLQNIRNAQFLVHPALRIVHALWETAPIEHVILEWPIRSR